MRWGFTLKKEATGEMTLVKQKKTDIKALRTCKIFNKTYA